MGWWYRLRPSTLLARLALYALVGCSLAWALGSILWLAVVIAWFAGALVGDAVIYFFLMWLSWAVDGSIFEED